MKATMDTFEGLPLLLTPQEVGQLLRCSSRSVYVMHGRGQLPGATRIGRRLLFRRDDLLKFLVDARIDHVVSVTEKR